MFKKKPNIPPRPKPPVTEQVLDDLKNAPDDDVVFMHTSSASGRYRNPKNNKKFVYGYTKEIVVRIMIFCCSYICIKIVDHIFSQIWCH
jgi:hypothetical protein